MSIFACLYAMPVYGGGKTSGKEERRYTVMSFPLSFGIVGVLGRDNAT